MRRVLFVANGHGESAIAACIGRAVADLAPRIACDLFPLVGLGTADGAPATVGPRRVMPSGGLVAMGNVRAFAADVRAGFATLLGEQLQFLAAASARYDGIVAVGDAYALALALVARRPTVFVGTAKSVYVAPYGPGERALLRRASRVFVRDLPTAERLRSQGVAAEAPGNVIVDLARDDVPPPGRYLGILPGSRASAYADGVRLAKVARALGSAAPPDGALVSVAPTLDATRYAEALAADGWDVKGADTRAPDDVKPSASDAPFVATAGDARVTLWTGSLGALLGASIAVLGQAGTGNEQAAAFGVPVIALDDPSSSAWYRMRQRRLLGDALALVPEDPAGAAAAIAAIVRDPARRAAMGEAGRARMGAPGGAAAIAAAIVRACG